jgi:hypothetical protein
LGSVLGPFPQASSDLTHYVTDFRHFFTLNENNRGLLIFKIFFYQKLVQLTVYSISTLLKLAVASRLFVLKGHSHEKVFEIIPLNDSLDTH